jgi:hypothetical protein
MRYMKDLARRFKNGFREGELGEAARRVYAACALHLPLCSGWVYFSMIWAGSLSTWRLVWFQCTRRSMPLTAMLTLTHAGTEAKKQVAAA